MDVWRSAVTQAHAAESVALKMERVAPSSHMHPQDQLPATLHSAVSLHFDIACTPPGSTTGRERAAPRHGSNVAKEWEEAAESVQTISQRWRGTTGNGDVPLRWARRHKMLRVRGGPEGLLKTGMESAKQNYWSLLPLISRAVIVEAILDFLLFFSHRLPGQSLPLGHQPPSQSPRSTVGASWPPHK